MDNILTDWRRRPWWMNLIFYFCVYMAFIYMPFDMFVKLFTQVPEQWEEIWFGITLNGWAAKVTEPIHWIIYGGGAWGFFKMRRWMWPWAFVYCLQVVIAMVVFNLINEKGAGLSGAIVSGLIFSLPALMLYRARSMFTTAKAGG